jgi:GNAT superfamily N-acetyltransferase
VPESNVEQTVEQLESSAGESFKQLYAIYAASIAAREQKGEGWIAAMIGSPAYRFFISKADGVVRGFSILFLPAAEGFALLEYMAVAPGERNHGLGAELFRRTVERAVTPEGGKLPVLLEIDSDREASSDRAIRTRRERFYRRLGCLRIAGLRYFMPLAGEGPAPEMDLFVHTSEPASGIARGELRRWLEIVYRDVYRCPADDPRIAQMLAGLPDRVRLE